MAKATRSSKRDIKQRRDPAFAYDEESLAFLASSSSIGGGTTLRHSSSDNVIVQGESTDFNAESIVNSELTPWANIAFLNSYLPSYSHVDSECAPISLNENSSLVNSNRSRGQEQNSTSDNSESCFGKITGAGRNYSSTRLDYLDIYSFCSVSPTPRVDTSDMSGKEETGVCSCSGSLTCAKCTAKGDDGELINSLKEALEKINFLTKEVTSLKKDVEKLKSDSESSGSHSGGMSGKASSSKEKVKPGQEKVKLSRVELEKERQLKLMKEKLDSRRGEISSSDESDSSLNMKKLRRRMPRKKKEECEAKLLSKLKVAGASFPEESSTGTDSSSSGKKSRSSGKVKSGAKLRKRPVIKTELWPHIIANEDDGDEVTSEDIGLARFLSCFTFIMINCGRKESEGRAKLLHAVSNILECLPWPDARTFHNLIMVKLEQGRLTWSAEFDSLALKFLDKKARLNLRAKSSSGNNYQSKSRNSGRNYSNVKSGRTNYGNSNYSSRSKSLYAVVCNQWNFGTCGYGDRCRKWHVCWTCAEAGKPGEQHKASSHSSSTGSRRSESRP